MHYTTTHGGEREEHALGFELAVGECLLYKRFEGLLHVDGILGTPCKERGVNKWSDVRQSL